MKFAIAVHGTRGDVEPAAAVALELRSRGHEVSMAVPPNLVTFAKSVGLSTVEAYGRDSQQQLESDLFRNWYNFRNPITVLKKARAYVTDGWMEMNETLAKLATGADLILTGTTYQEVAANVAEAYRTPFAALHYFPCRANNHILPVKLPMSVTRLIWSAVEWMHWRLLKPAYDGQRRHLGLPKTNVRAVRWLIEQGALEIQAYDKALFPGLEQQWGGRRPLVGAMTLELVTNTDAAVEAWIKVGRPPIFFGLGSMSIDNPANAVAMIIKACSELGERALICSGVLALEGVTPTADVMFVPDANHSEVFPRCRAIIHHGGSGTAAACIRSGVPALVLWVGADQPVWGARVKHLSVGASQRFSTTTLKTLLAALRTVLGPECAARAKALAGLMTLPHESVTMTADILEARARATSIKSVGVAFSPITEAQA
jgi:UDP:flavonoid glycosyltransferase YjiC (YdhE family)